jgi:hypothetical protein
MSSITSSSEIRGWLKKHGKKRYIDFDERERRELRNYFDALDEDGSGWITVEELEEPLIGLGLAENRAEVSKMVQDVDADGSGEIEFEEFLQIIKGGDKNSTMAKFFKDMIAGSFMNEFGQMPFRLMVSTFRRKQMMNAMFSAEPNERTKGERVMTAYSKQIGTARSANTARSIATEDEELKVGFPKFPRIIDTPANRRPYSQRRPNNHS